MRLVILVVTDAKAKNPKIFGGVLLSLNFYAKRENVLLSITLV